MRDRPRRDLSGPLPARPSQSAPCPADAEQPPDGKGHRDDQPSCESGQGRAQSQPHDNEGEEAEGRRCTADGDRQRVGGTGAHPPRLCAVPDEASCASRALPLHPSSCDIRRMSDPAVAGQAEQSPPRVASRAEINRVFGWRGWFGTTPPFNRLRWVRVPWWAFKKSRRERRWGPDPVWWPPPPEPGPVSDPDQR